MNQVERFKASMRRSAALDFLNSKSITELEEDIRVIFPELPIGHLQALNSLVQEELAKPERQQVSV